MAPEREGDMRRPAGPADLRDEYHHPEMRAMLLTYLNMMVGRLDAIERFRRGGVSSMSYLDLTIVVYAFIWAGEGGSREMHVTNTLGAHRRSVRDSLAKLVRGGILHRDKDGYYFPTVTAAEIANGLFESWHEEMRAMCDAYEAYRNALAGK
jgi:hypothetical protein